MKVKNKVVKIVIFLLCATCFATEMNLKNKIELKNISNCQIQEENQNELYDFQIIDGIPVIFGEISFNNSAQSYKVVFIIETGTAFSWIYANEDNEVNIIEEFKFYNSKMPQQLLSLCSINFKSSTNSSNFCVNDLYIRLSESSASLNQKMKDLDCDFVGILGNDVLTQKSLFFSFTKQKFGWPLSIEKPKANNTETYFMNNIQQNVLGQTFYWHTVYVDDEVFNSESYFLFQKWDKTGSRYWLGTGSYSICTAPFDFAEQVDKHNYKGAIIETTNPFEKYGEITIPEISFFGKKFKNIKATATNETNEIYVLKSIKLLGAQVLSAFDIYFDKNDSESVKQIYFYPVENKEYEDFRRKFD